MTNSNNWLEEEKDLNGFYKYTSYNSDESKFPMEILNFGEHEGQWYVTRFKRHYFFESRLHKERLFIGKKDECEKFIASYTKNHQYISYSLLHMMRDDILHWYLWAFKVPKLWVRIWKSRRKYG